MPNIQIKVKKDHRLDGQIMKAIQKGAIAAINEMKVELKMYEPAVWKNRGAMQDTLEKVGLAEFTKPKALANAWHQTIDNVKVDRRYNDLTINIFNSRFLDEGTLWVGINEPIRDFSPKTEWKPRGDISNRKDKYGSRYPIYNGGYRPISKSGKGWTWELNPYPNNGYWMLYEQGWGGYAAHNFIKNAYSTMFEASVGNMFNESGIKFSEKSIKKFSTRINAAINEEVKK